MPKIKTLPPSFDNFYATIWADRWPQLKAALQKQPEVYARIYFGSTINIGLAHLFHSSRPLWGKGYPMEEIPEQDGRKLFYPLDVASLWPVHYLIESLPKTAKILDLCSAPGGKSLAILSHLLHHKHDFHLTCNEPSAPRKNRLEKALSAYLTEDELKKVTTTSYDGRKWCLHEQNAYDAILLDAPCSSERHVLQDPKHLSIWKNSRSYYLQQDQWSLISSAALVLKPGGHLVYSTCSINPEENEKQMERLLQSKHHFSLISLDLQQGEAASAGHYLLPDQTGNGPIYFCVLQKQQASS